MEKKKITVTIKDKDGKVLLEYSEPVEISRGAMENITWIKKGVWTIKELLNINISQELDRAREEGRKELLDSIIEGVTQLKDLVSMFNPMSPEIRAKQSGEIEAYNGLLEKLSKLTTK